MWNVKEIGLRYKARKIRSHHIQYMKEIRGNPETNRKLLEGFKQGNGLIGVQNVTLATLWRRNWTRGKVETGYVLVGFINNANEQ